MRLRDRLAGLSVGPSRSAGTAVGVTSTAVPAGPTELPPGAWLDGSRSERIAQLRGLIADVIAREAGRDRRSPLDLARREPRMRGPALLEIGEVRATEHGPLRVIERWLQPQHCHGRVPVSGALAADVQALAQLAFKPALQDADLSRLLILDTETTGLSGGTGTVPFLVGLAYFEEGALKVEQLFLDELGAEAPMLHHLR